MRSPHSGMAAAYYPLDPPRLIAEAGRAKSAARHSSLGQLPWSVPLVSSLGQFPWPVPLASSIGQCGWPSDAVFSRAQEAVHSGEIEPDPQLRSNINLLLPLLMTASFRHWHIPPGFPRPRGGSCHTTSFSSRRSPWEATFPVPNRTDHETPRLKTHNQTVARIG